jgi:hypothetical protein
LLCILSKRAGREYRQQGASACFIEENAIEGEGQGKLFISEAGCEA